MLIADLVAGSRLPGRLTGQLAMMNSIQPTELELVVSSDPEPNTTPVGRQASEQAISGQISSWPVGSLVSVSLSLCLVCLLADPPGLHSVLPVLFSQHTAALVSCDRCQLVQNAPRSQLDSTRRACRALV